MYFCILYISGKVSYTVSAYFNKLNHGIYLPKLEDHYSGKRETQKTWKHTLVNLVAVPERNKLYLKSVSFTLKSVFSLQFHVYKLSLSLSHYFFSRLIKDKLMTLSIYNTSDRRTLSFA